MCYLSGGKNLFGVQIWSHGLRRSPSSRTWHVTNFPRICTDWFLKLEVKQWLLYSNVSDWAVLVCWVFILGTGCSFKSMKTSYCIRKFLSIQLSVIFSYRKNFVTQEIRMMSISDKKKTLSCLFLGLRTIKVALFFESCSKITCFGQ